MANGPKVLAEQRAGKEYELEAIAEWVVMALPLNVMEQFRSRIKEDIGTRAITFDPIFYQFLLQKIADHTGIGAEELP